MIYWGAKGSGLFLHYQVIGATECWINALNMGVDYEFAIVAYNAGGVGSRSAVITAPATQPVPEPPGPVPPDLQYKIYEAEDGILVNCDRRSEGTEASGGATVGNMHHEGASFEIRNVDGGPGGEATLRLVYSNGNPPTDVVRTEVFVNGVSVGIFTLPNTGGWSEYIPFDIPTPITVTPGETNSIKFAGGQGGFNSDYIQVIYQR
jgi:hypothetical protein